MDKIQKYHLYINLEKRKEKNIHCIDELKKIGITEPNRFNAYEDKIGLIGCAKSHIACIEIAKNNSWPFVCIFEDDLSFIDHEYEIINDDLLKVDYTCCTHAYIIKNHYYDILLQNLNEGLELKIKDPNNYLYNIDEHIRKLQERDNWLCFYPILATQIEGYSDNFNEVIDYNDRILNIPK
jgi:hypothetical protein